MSFLRGRYNLSLSSSGKNNFSEEKGRLACELHSSGFQRETIKIWGIICGHFKYEKQ